VAESTGDGLRLTGILPSTKYKKLHSYLTSVIGLIDVCIPGLRPSPVSILHSRKGCDRQAAHMDGVRANPGDEEDIWMEAPPLAVILALEDNTSVLLYPRSHKYYHDYYKNKEREGGTGSSEIPQQKYVSLQAGEMLIFRQDLLHHGEGYPHRSNTRLFVYLDNDLVTRPPNAVYMVESDLWMFWFKKETNFEQYDAFGTPRPSNWEIIGDPIISE
jgi:hypothetical protein